MCCGGGCCHSYFSCHWCCCTCPATHNGWEEYTCHNTHNNKTCDGAGCTYTSFKTCCYLTEIGCCQTLCAPNNTVTYNEPMIIGTVKIFKFRDNIRKYVDYKFKKINKVLIDVSAYNISNFRKPQYFIETNNNVGFITKKTYKYPLFAPAMFNPKSINILSTLLSYKLMKTENFEKNFAKKFQHYGNIILRGYVNDIYNKAVDFSNMKIKDTDKTLFVARMFQYFHNEKPLYKSLVENWYANLEDGTQFYCLKLNVIVVFILKLIIKRLNELNKEYDTVLQEVFYDFIWKYIKQINFKITTCKINKFFYNKTGIHLFDNNYDSIFKNWFKFINNNYNDVIELLQIDILCDDLSFCELDSATSKTYKILLNEKMPHNLLLDKFNEYIKLTSESSKNYVSVKNKNHNNKNNTETVSEKQLLYENPEKFKDFKYEGKNIIGYILDKNWKK